jgi:flagellar hook-length control protein FliK
MEMLHQDLRPDNILIDKTGTAKIIDFGSVRVAGGAEAAPPDPTARATAESASPLAALAQPPAAGERPQKAAPERAAKAETAAKSNETALPPGMRPVEAADRPVHARAAEAAGAQPAAKDAIETASSDDIQGKDAGAAPTPDDHGPDPAPAAEGRGAAPPAAALAHASAPVRGSPETVAALAAQIVKKLDGRATRFDLELDPAGLGKVDVRLEIGAQGRITAALTCDNPHAANELRARANELQRALEQAGFDLSGGLSFDVADNGRQQGQPWQDQSQDGAGGFRGQAFRAALETAGEADAGASGPLRLRRGITAGLDLRI